MMGGRDHAIECETCHCMRGGFDDIPCLCDFNCDERLTNLAHNLAIGAALCEAHTLGWWANDAQRGIVKSFFWEPGCGKQAP